MSAKIKICGIRRNEDADYINEAMPDWAGFVFWPESLRRVGHATAARLRKRIDPEIKVAGVFVDAEPEEAASLVRESVIDIVQLHGNEDDDYITRLRKLIPAGTPVWKAIKIRTRRDMDRAAASKADLVLLDNGKGTGRSFDHELIRDIGRDYLIAGGLNCANIAETIRRFRPYGVDISGGVETDGFKDREKILRAVDAVRREG